MKQWIWTEFQEKIKLELMKAELKNIYNSLTLRPASTAEEEAKNLAKFILSSQPFSFHVGSLSHYFRLSSFTLDRFCSWRISRRACISSLRKKAHCCVA